MASLKIGQVAALAGVGIDTVRYYERLGLLPEAARQRSGYRMFDTTAVERIQLVKHLQELGLSLEEIDGLIGAIAGGAECGRESGRIEVALRRTEEKIAALESMRAKLAQALERCG